MFYYIYRVLQPDAGIPTFYMLYFAPPNELLDGVLKNDHQPSAFDTSGSLHETTRLHFPQASGHLTVRTHLHSRAQFSPVSLTKTRQ